jgi:hypothetical protein
MKIYLVAVMVDAEWSYLLERNSSSPCVFWSAQEAKAHLTKIHENSSRIRYRLLEVGCKEITFTLPTTEI